MTRYPPVPYRGPLMAVCNIPTRTRLNSSTWLRLSRLWTAPPWPGRGPAAPRLRYSRSV